MNTDKIAPVSRVLVRHLFWPLLHARLNCVKRPYFKNVFCISPTKVQKMARPTGFYQTARHPGPNRAPPRR
jgi:hypothetical protein